MPLHGRDTAASRAYRAWRPPLEPITSLRNRRIVDAAKLTQRKHRRRQGRFLAEGLQIIGMALDAGSVPLEVFVCPDQLRGDVGPALLARAEAGGATITHVAPNVMDRLTDREEPQGLVATFPCFDTGLGRLPPPPPGPSLVLVLDRLQDPGNCGACIRTADAVGAHAVVCVEPCVDPFDPKTLNASMGSLFNLPVLTTDDPAALPAALAPWTLVAASAHEGGIVWDSDALHGPVALVLGNEAHGLAEDLAAIAQRTVRLPLAGKAESLNVAVAGGALAYEWLRVNAPARSGSPRGPA